MSGSVADHAPARTGEPRSRLGMTIVLATVLASALIVLVSGDAWRWPYQYGDDLILEVSTWSYRDEKLPSEGRWLVWLWHELFGGLSAATDFRLSLVAWCASMALVASRLTSGVPWHTVLCAVALSVNPAALELLHWPHTALPMMVSLLAGTMLLFACSFAVRRLAIALVVATCAIMLAQQLFALLLIAVALFIVTTHALRAPAWDVRALLRDGTTLVLAGAAGTTAGLLISYALNNAAFGHFGLDIATWRQADVASSSRTMLAAINMRAVLSTASTFTGHLLWPVTMASAGAWSVLALRHHRDVRVVWLVLVLLLGVVLAPVSVGLLSGAPVPERRGGVTSWLAAIATLVLLVDLLAVMRIARSRRLVWGTMAALTSVALWFTGRELASGSRIRQSHDAHLGVIAQDVRSALGTTARARTLIVIGTPHPFDSLGRNDAWWVSALLRSRLEPDLVGSVVYCATADCDVLRGQSLPSTIQTQPGYPNPGYLHQSGDVLLLRFRRDTTSRSRSAISSRR